MPDRSFAEVEDRFARWTARRQPLSPEEIPDAVLEAMAGVMVTYFQTGGEYILPGSPLAYAFADLARAAYAEGLRDGRADR